MFEYAFISFDIRVPSKKSSVFTFGSKAPAKILQSCNGLRLCHVTPYKFFVYNPCVNLFKMLPQPNMSKLKPSSSIDQIPSYQSFNGFEDGIYWNGAIHWLGYVYRSSLHSRLDILVDHPVLTTIKLPAMVDGIFFCNCKLFESRGSLLLACKGYPQSPQLHILEMRNVYSGWSVKYLVNLDDLMMQSPSSWGIHSSVWCIVLGEREEDSFMVIESYGKVLQYKIMLNTVHTLFDFGSTSPRESFPFIASFAGVYAIDASIPLPRLTVGIKGCSDLQISDATSLSANIFKSIEKHVKTCSKHDAARRREK
ncbi:hypothetical protein Tco_1541040 [Tanacetum coccineum]